MAAHWQVGDRIHNRWEIKKILGGWPKSGMGIVYVVYDPEFREVFAAKTFQEEAFAKNPRTFQAFLREARAWVNLDIHQNVTRARFVTRIENKPFLFLEYVSGGDLDGWIGTPRLTEDLPQVLRFAIQFCDGMIYALSKGIKAHRDIKPENCLITEDRTLKVTDFGLAKVFDDASLGDEKEARPRETEHMGGLGIVFSRTGNAAGTPPYMAPEQFADAKHVDVRADVYSFGVMLLRMLTGQFLVRGRGRSWKEWEQLHKATPVPVLDGARSAANAVLQGCLAQAPERRFADFGVVRERLAQVYEKLTGQAAARPASGAELRVIDWQSKGLSLLHLYRDKEALACYDRALEINPRSHEAWNSKGRALGSMFRREEAMACYDRALEINPHAETAWTNKGILLAVLKRLEEAMACYDRALEINPHLELAWNSKGKALNQLERPEEAMACYDRVLELNPRDATGWNNKGELLNKLGRPEEALMCHERALEFDPRWGLAWTYKGMALSKLERSDEALACWDRVLEIEPHDGLACLCKGHMLNKLGRPEEAITAFNQAGGLIAASLGRKKRSVGTEKFQAEFREKLRRGTVQ